MDDATLGYYREPAAMTQLGGDDDALAGIPGDPAGACRVVQGLIVHEMWAAVYGVDVPPARLDELEDRSAAAIVRRILDLEPAPLVEPRPAERRAVGNCRQYSVLTCALLRRAGAPARARCGFATYFASDRFVDHWVVEHWDSRAAMWVRTDPQLDDVQRRELDLDFDPLDLPEGRFLSGGEAWQLCRSGRADPDLFGILEYWGAWFVRNNVVRDLAALNKVELLPWDAWGLMETHDVHDEQGDELVDQVATATCSDDWHAIRDLYDVEARLRVPRKVTSHRTGRRVRVPT